MTLDAASARLVKEFTAAGGPAIHEMEPAEARAIGEQIVELIGPGPEVGAVETRAIETADGDTIVARIFTPTTESRGTIVYFHGGGWVLGALDEFDSLARALTDKTSCEVVLVDYRLAPEHRFPTALEDAWAALLWVAEHRIGSDAPLIVAGDSAGANLAAVLARRARDTDAVSLDLQVLVYPVTDCRFDTESYLDPENELLLTRDSMLWYWDHYLPDVEQRLDPDASPLRAQDLTGLVPAIVLTAEHDVLRSEGNAYAVRLADAGVEVRHRCFEGQMHAFFTMVNVLPGSTEGLDYVADSIREAIG